MAWACSASWTLPCSVSCSVALSRASLRSRSAACVEASSLSLRSSDTRNDSLAAIRRCRSAAAVVCAALSLFLSAASSPFPRERVGARRWRCVGQRRRNRWVCPPPAAVAVVAAAVWWSSGGADLAALPSAHAPRRAVGGAWRRGCECGHTHPGAHRAA
eukprot:scaffold45512_cov31-Tisochrysis_lutea.AAC.1